MPTFIRLIDYDSADRKEKEFCHCINIHRLKQGELTKIPGSPIAYWISDSIKSAFYRMSLCKESISFKAGLATGDNSIFQRNWFEISIFNLSFSTKKCKKSENILRWYPCNSGGENRKWYGNLELVVDWQEDGLRIRKFKNDKNKIASRAQNTDSYFKNGITWNKLSTSAFSMRYKPVGFIFDDTSRSAFLKGSNYSAPLAFFNSKVASFFLGILNPTLSFTSGDVENLPYSPASEAIISASSNLSISKSDWDLQETSWDFLRSPLLTNYRANCIKKIIDENLTDWSWPSAYQTGGTIDLAEQAESFKNNWTALFLELHKNEEENNSIFIDLYGLQDELTPDVPYSEITILQEELVESARKEGRIEFDESVLARQFVSYGVGCLVGRYSVEKDGLILADAGATIEDFLAKVPDAHFLPDPDGILPLTDEDDFIDDLPTRFKAWLRFISGDRYEDNLRWIEERLSKDLRSYFIRDFYKEHLRRYKNRPIYWMVTSPSGTFRALLYLHRYTKDSVGKILNDYLRPYRTKLDQKLRGLQSALDSSSSSQTEKAGARKRITQIEKYIRELELWEKDSLYPTALARIELDLDDGVKVNYRKLSVILEPVKQLDLKEE